MATVRDYMTAHPYTLGRQQSMAHAHELMRTHGMCHVPVLDGGRLVGIVSERDLHLIGSLDKADPKTVTVEEAMSQEPWTVEPDTPIATVAATMAANRYGAAIVVERGKVLGIFTTIDALRALVDATSTAG